MRRRNRKQQKRYKWLTAKEKGEEAKKGAIQKASHVEQMKHKIEVNGTGNARESRPMERTPTIKQRKPRNNSESQKRKFAEEGDNRSKSKARKKKEDQLENLQDSVLMPHPGKGETQG